ncbi:hypothetical protein B0S93_0005 [Caldicellulosiruptor bescii]|nr:hypothetical protein B0S93_0005 [Caldicellulosiruptor bescii]
MISINQNNGVITLVNLDSRKTVDIKAHDITVFNNGFAAVRLGTSGVDCRKWEVCY